MEIITQSEIETVLSSDDKYLFPVTNIILTNKLVFDEYFLDIKNTEETDLAAILYTSGSTGKPKGVSITFGNLNAFLQSFFEIGYSIDETDKFLQPFHLTFVMSLVTYVVPIVKGACVYTTPHDQIKYISIANLLEKHSLTFAFLVPSTIRYFEQLFDDLYYPKVRYCLCCGEALPLDVITKWSKYIPNAVIDNIYGCTENTLLNTRYRFTKEAVNKSHNGTLSIGKPVFNTKVIIIDENNREIGKNLKGELCIAGSQLTPGYWNNIEKNKAAFFTYEDVLFYRTGDICYKDDEGDILYCGRLDSQIKVNGFRIELGEIEHYAKIFLPGCNIVCLPFDNSMGNTAICAFIEKADADQKGLIKYLRTKLPPYMIPTKTIICTKFPANTNGKIDKKVLKSMI
jgi:acyl-coenzyme A synthetase/AMP-(fatty) acid ligase